MLSRLLSKFHLLTKDAPIVKHDEYLAWLNFANAGMLHPGNIHCFEIAIQNLPSNNPVLEIGSFAGLSTNVISHLLKKHGKQNTLFTTDKWIFESAEDGGPLGDSNLTHAEYKHFVKESFVRNIQFFSKDRPPAAMELSSDEFFKEWNNQSQLKDVFGGTHQLGGPLSFVYIDGNHQYDFVKRDYKNSAKQLEVGGYLFFDDSADQSDQESASLMNDVLNDERFELVIKNPNYLFKKIKD